MKKALVSLIILILFGAAVFYLGWVQFDVPIGNYGLMLSKTSGVYPELIHSGKFLWRWERLLPTNTQLRLFSLDPVGQTDTFSSSLPSAQLYATKLEGNPDFTYTITVESTGKIQPQDLIPLVEQHNLQDQEALEKLIRDEIHQFNVAVTAYLLEETQNDTTGLRIQTVTTQELVEATAFTERAPWLEIVSTDIRNVKMPDASLYLTAKNAYLNSIIEGTGSQEITENNNFTALVNLGEILTKYPALVEFMVAGDVTTTLDFLVGETASETKTPFLQEKQ
ncbi:MAG: hypothetical protein IKW26_05895 [Treponema sp.]|nr:hypothetical protein [Treponema sp.]